MKSFPKTIGIIGGKGKMGALFADLFRKQKYKVLISDRNTLLTNQKLARLSDVVIVSVPIDKTVSVIKEIVPYVRKRALLTDLTSVKREPMKAMLKSNAAVIGLHPMFNNTSFSQYQRVIVSPVRPRGWLPWLKSFFDTYNLITISLTPEEHDRLMPYVQALVHFAEISFAKTLKDAGVKVPPLLEIASPASAIKIEMVARILAQDPNLYGNILIETPENISLLKKYLQAAQKLFRIVQNKDLKGFNDYFTKASAFLGDYKKDALRESDWMIAQLIEKNKRALIELQRRSKQKENRNTKIQISHPAQTIVTLGPELSYSDLMSEKVLMMIKKRFRKTFFKTVQATFEQVFQALEQKKALLCIVPLNNKVSGSVNETYDNLMCRPDLEIKAMVSLPIHHCFAILPWAKKQDLTVVMSHPQALSQASTFLKKRYPDLEKIPTTSTSAAFESVKNRKSEHCAVIGPQVAARKSGFKILHKNIGNEKDNTTFFGIIGRKNARGFNFLKKIPKHTSRFTSIVFHFAKDHPGSLAQVFNLFAVHHINLTKIESRPASKKQGYHIFLLEFEGDAKDKLVQKIVRLVKKEVKKLKILGSFSLLKI